MQMCRSVDDAPILVTSGHHSMKTIIRLAALAMVGGATCGAAPAVDLPPRKPGLWQITMIMPGGKIPPRDMQMCIDAKTDAEMARLSTSASQGMCAKNDTRRDGDTVTTNSVCTIGQKETSTQAVTRFAGDSAYHTEITSRSGTTGGSRLVMTQDAKWTGACPADMQPGDVTMPNGVKMNVKTIMSGH
jgi:hypothetical protein